MVKDDNSKQRTVVVVNNPYGLVQVMLPCQTIVRPSGQANLWLFFLQGIFA